MSRQEIPSVISIGPRGWVEVRPDLERRGRHTALGFHKRWWTGVRFYHRDGLVYEIDRVGTQRPLGLLSKVLAHTVYNPWLEFTYQYRAVASYRLEELRDAVAAAIRTDDDVLTQFADADELLAELSAATEFQSVVSVVRRGAGP